MGVIIYLILLSIYIFIPIILTIGSELIMLKLLGLKEKEIYKNLLVISIITDIIFSIVLFLTNKTYKEFGLFYLLLLLLIVILIEYFWLKMNIENDINFVLSVQNSMVGKLKMEDGVIKTTKEEKHLHGIGLSNVIELIEKNGGDFTIVTKDDHFGFSMIVPLKKSL